MPLAVRHGRRIMRAVIASRVMATNIWPPARSTDGLSGTFVERSHGRRRLAEVAAKQARNSAFFLLWSHAHPSAIELQADRLASAPGDPKSALLHQWWRGCRDGLFSNPAVGTNTGSCRAAPPSTR
jgi:hypothetical protein